MSEAGPTLCFPDAEKSCFACCPPIRPAGYDHLQYKNIVKRMLRENTLEFARQRNRVLPITGFSCWALGYLDRGYRLVGCLLHPAQNRGMDLRYRVDYGEKCRRESCPEAKVFSELGINERKFWLNLADGLDSFNFSSREINPLFKMTGWGVDILQRIALRENGRIFHKRSFFQAYPFFSTLLNPRANAYLLNQIVKQGDLDVLKTRSFCSRFEAFSETLSRRLRMDSRDRQGNAHTHLLKLDPCFLDFLRCAAAIPRIDQEGALRMKTIVDEAIGRFKEQECVR